MPPGARVYCAALLETLTLFVLLVGLFGLIVPVFAGSDHHVAGRGRLCTKYKRARLKWDGWDWFLLV